ncbi:hypothetical protein BWI97_26495 [Siphonobacter sp. BAB-5405]|nr:hypothetical protein BWI97_26495 [Siphonobacter sp. BAB-5405]
MYNDFTEGQLGQLSTLKQEGIYRIIQEVLTNIVKHSQATEAVVQVFLNKKLVRITVEDDGIGYTLNEKTNGIGIRNMYKRAELAGLILTLDGGSGGTLVSLETAMKD